MAGVKVELDALRRIGDRLRQIPVRTRIGGSTAVPVLEKFHAALTAEDPSNPGRYQWKLQLYDAGTWADATPAIDSGDDYTARELNDAKGLAANTRVKLCLSGYDGDGKPIYLFAHNARDQFPVDVVKDGGSAGDSATTCTYTYTVKDSDGNTLKKNAAGDDATSMSPTWARPALGKMVEATHGTAYYASNGDLVLYQVDEVPTKVKRSCT